MYYDLFNDTKLADNDLKAMGLENADKQRLSELGIYRLEIIRPEVPDPATQGLTENGKPFPSPDDPYLFIQQMEVYNFLDYFKKEKKEDIAALRWSIQSSNLILEDGTIVATSPEAQTRMAATLQSLQYAPAFAAETEDSQPTIDFKAASGWLRLTLAELNAIAVRIAEYVQACYAREKEIADAIDAAQSLEELNAININVGWPQYNFAPEQEEDEEVESETELAEEIAESEARALDIG